MSKGFTKGPWSIFRRDAKDGEESYTVQLDIEHSGQRIGSVSIRENLPYEANAHLIAAAPLMYEALQTVMSTHCGCFSFSNPKWHSDSCARPKVEAALSAAEGKSHV